MCNSFNKNRFLTSIMQMTEQNLLNDLVRNESKYRQLLKNLILEGLIKMLEPKIYVR